MSLIAWGFVLVIVVPVVGLILAEYATESGPDVSRLDSLDRPRPDDCHYCERPAGEGHGLVTVNGSPHRCPVVTWGRR